MFDRKTYEYNYNRSDAGKARAHRYKISAHGKQKRKEARALPERKVRAKQAFNRWYFGDETVDQAALLAAQGGVCKVCGATDPGCKQGWHTDHIHGSSVIRGILCYKCNLRAGNGSYDDLYRARQMVEYLEPWCEGV